MRQPNILHGILGGAPKHKDGILSSNYDSLQGSLHISYVYKGKLLEKSFTASDIKSRTKVNFDSQMDAARYLLGGSYA